MKKGMCLKVNKNSFSATTFKNLYMHIIAATMIYLLVSLDLAIVFNPSPEARFLGYAFLHSFLSELGTTVTSAGMKNLLSCLIFNISIALSMLILIPYWHIRKSYIEGHKWLGYFAFYCCGSFSLGLFIGAVVPYNISHKIHSAAVDYALCAAIVGLVMMVDVFVFIVWLIADMTVFRKRFAGDTRLCPEPAGNSYSIHKQPHVQYKQESFRQTL